jgi:hypothetical protein
MLSAILCNISAENQQMLVLPQLMLPTAICHSTPAPSFVHMPDTHDNTCIHAVLPAQLFTHSLSYNCTALHCTAQLMTSLPPHAQQQQHQTLLIQSRAQPNGRSPLFCLYRLTIFRASTTDGSQMKLPITHHHSLKPPHYSWFCNHTAAAA